MVVPPWREAEAAAALDRSAALLAAARDPVARLAALGLVAPAGDGGLALSPPPGPRVPGPLEAWAFRAGVKPVAFVTVAPADEAAVVAAFGAAHVERRERNVAIGPQDRWRDDRVSGAPRVELYLAHDRADAARAAALQADPTRNLAGLGALLGYPPCCVAAFGAQRDRANNTLNRYLAAARTPAGATPWPWPLNELHVKLLAFYPCSYRCEAALAIATATVGALDAAHPGRAAALAAHLARRVLYLDSDHQRWLERDEAIELTDDALEIGGSRYDRIDPRLGFLADFG